MADLIRTQPDFSSVEKNPDFLFPNACNLCDSSAAAKFNRFPDGKRTVILLFDSGFFRYDLFQTMLLFQQFMIFDSAGIIPQISDDLIGFFFCGFPDADRFLFRLIQQDFTASGNVVLLVFQRLLILFDLRKALDRKSVV